jgi:hypothetical protein
MIMRRTTVSLLGRALLGVRDACRDIRAATRAG